MEEKEERFAPSLAHLYPVIISLAITGGLGYPPSSQGATTPPIVAFEGNTPAGASLNALYFVLALGASATAMFLLIRRGRVRLLQKFLKIALLAVCFSASVWYGSIMIEVFGSPLGEPVATAGLLIASAIAAGVLGVFVFGRNQRRQLVGVTVISALTGLFLGASIPILTVLFLAGALVVYDIVAVFKGPIGAIAKKVEVGELPGAVFNYRELSIGMGDLVFYSLVATASLWRFGLISFIVSSIGILIGTFLGFKALNKYEMFPGLPFSLILGILGMLAGAFIAGNLSITILTGLTLQPSW